MCILRPPPLLFTTQTLTTNRKWMVVLAGVCVAIISVLAFLLTVHTLVTSSDQALARTSAARLRPLLQRMILLPPCRREAEYVEEVNHSTPGRGMCRLDDIAGVICLLYHV